MKKAILFAVLLVFQTSMFAQGTVQIPSGKDNTIYSESLNSNGQGRIYAGTTCSSNLRRGLLYFDIASVIPAGSVITSVSLDLNVDNVSAGASNSDYSLHRMSTDWGEGTSNGGGTGATAVAPDATWQDAMLGTSTWTTPGGDFLTASATATLSTSVGVFNWTSSGMTADIQLWLDNPGMNFGWSLIGDEATVCSARRFGSAELGTGPSLTVNYTCPPIAICQDITTYLDGSGLAVINAQDLDNGSTAVCGTNLTYNADFTTFDCSSVTDVTTTPSLIISAVYDGPLTGGVPKGVELYAINDIADLSVYGIGAANNGGGTDGEEYTFPAVSVTAGTYIYVSSESTEFANFFGFSPDYSTGFMSINGDDAIELFQNGAVIDVFGDINVDGTGQTWDYVDGWALRNNLETPNAGTFNDINWTYSGINALDGETTNATATTPVPVGTFNTLSNLGNPVVLTVTDDLSNMSTCSASVIVLDTLPPIVSCLGATSFALDITGNFTLTSADLDNGTTDVCGSVILSLSQTIFTCNDLGVNPITLYATDQYGNIDSCSTDITITDPGIIIINEDLISHNMCFDDLNGAIEISVNGGSTNYTFDWDNDVTGDYDDTEDLTGLATGVYVVSVLDDNNCEAQETFTVTSTVAEITTSFVVTNVDCFGADNGEIDMTTSAGPATTTFDWDNDVTGDNDDLEDITGLSPAMYHVTIIDGNNCVKIDSAEVLEGTVVDLTTIVTGFDLMSNQSGAVAYQWLNCADHSIISGATNQTYTAIANGDYEVEISLGTCVDTSECKTITGVGIDDHNDAIELVEIYPNPSNGKIYIELGNNAEVVTITVIDINGKVVANKMASNDQVSLDLSEVENGIYFVQIRRSNEMITKKISITK